MKGTIFIIEGGDGTGKTTLANELHRVTKGTHIHTNLHRNPKAYNENIMKAAITISDLGDDVIIDRWCVVEYVYGKAFRNGQSYKTDEMIEKYNADNIVWIFCRNDDIVENHKKNKEEREEMYDSMEEVSKLYDEYVAYSLNNWIHIPWIIYDFSKTDVKDFVKELKS